MCIISVIEKAFSTWVHYEIEDIMEGRISWTNYLGYRILIADFSGIQDETEYMRAFDAVEQEIIHQPKDSVKAMIVDISHSQLSPAVSTRGRKLVDAVHAAGIKDYPTAVVGGSNLQKTVVSAIALFRRDVFVAETRDMALSQLASYLKTAKAEK